jgi:hypothetical protein
VIALAAAGIAIADPGTPASTSLVSATFNANTPGPIQSSTCTPVAPGHPYTTTDAVFTGTASNTDARFSGPVTAHVRDTFDTTNNVGSLKGDVEIDNTTTPPGNFHGHLNAVLVGSLAQGWIDGHLGDGSHFMGSFSATFSTASGFTSFNIGSGSGTLTAIAWNGHCDQGNPQKPPHGPKHDDHHHGDDNKQQ